MVQWVVGSIPHGGPIDLFLGPASAPQLAKQRLWMDGWMDGYRYRYTVYIDR